MRRAGKRVKGKGGAKLAVARKSPQNEGDRPSLPELELCGATQLGKESHDGKHPFSL
jgi:hypothetical protein